MRKEPEIVTVTLKKHNGMGLSIVAAKVRNNFSFSFWGYRILTHFQFLCTCCRGLSAVAEQSLRRAFGFGIDLDPIAR